MRQITRNQAAFINARDAAMRFGRAMGKFGVSADEAIKGLEALAKSLPPLPVEQKWYHLIPIIGPKLWVRDIRNWYSKNPQFEIPDPPPLPSDEEIRAEALKDCDCWECIDRRE
jgi:hypothetical protein